MPKPAEKEMESRSLPGEGSDHRLTSPALVGRNRELQLLLGAASSPPSVAIVEGEAGVGKTRLMQEVLARPELRAHRKLVGRCYRIREPFPLGPVVEAFRGLSLPRTPLNPVVGVLRPLLPELADRLPAPPEPLEDSQAERHMVFRAAVELLDGLGPTILALEDLHWADEGSIEFVGFLLENLGRDLSVLLTFRREDLGERSPLPTIGTRLPVGVSGTRIVLVGLPSAGVGRLVRAILGTDEVSDEFASFVHDRTAGIPFAVEEVLGLLRDRRDLVRHADRWERRALDRMGVPSGIRDAVLERVAGLSPTGRAVVEAAAVLGAPATEEILAQVAGLSEESLDGLREVQSRGLLWDAPAGRMGLRHSLAQEAIEGAIPGPVRRALHLRCAAALESVSPKPLARLAHHYRGGGRPREWARYAEQAADCRASVGDDRGAFWLLREPLESEELPVRTRARLAVKLGKYALDGLEHREAVPVVGRILEKEPIPVPDRGRLRLYLGWLVGQAGDIEACFEEVRRAVPELRRNPGLQARAMTTLGMPWIRSGTVGQHLRWLDRAAQIAGSLDDSVVNAVVRVDRAYALTYVGHPEWPNAVDDLPEKSGSVEAARQLARGYLNLAYASAFVGHYAQAGRFAARARAVCEEISYRRFGVALEAPQLIVRWATGRWDGLEPAVRRLLEEMREVPHVAVDAEAILGFLLLARGDLDEAEPHLEQAVELGLRTGMFASLSIASAGLAELRLARRQVQEACEVTASALRVVMGKKGWAWCADLAPVAVQALAEAGREDEAAVLVRGFERGLRGRDAPAARASVPLCWAILLEARGEFGAAARRFSKAQEALGDLPRLYLATRAAEGAGRSLLALGERSGTDDIEEALRAFASLGASWDVNRARRVLRRHGVVRPHRRGRRGYGNRLSPRELEAARLAAEGKTNREIATILFLSPWTVSQHTASAVRKLGLRSRVELNGVSWEAHEKEP